MTGRKEGWESGSSVFTWFRKRKKKESTMVLEKEIGGIGWVCIWKREEIVQNLCIGKRSIARCVFLDPESHLGSRIV